MTVYAVPRKRLLSLLLAGVALFLAYQYVRIFMIGVTWAPWKEPRTFLDKDARGTFDITFFPDHRFLTRSDYENGSCARAGRVRGTMGRPVLGRLHYVDCPGLIKFHFPPAGVEIACIELETAGEEGQACQPPSGLPRVAVFYRVMGFLEDGSGLYDAGSLLRRVSDPDLNNLNLTVDRLAPLTDEEGRAQGDPGRTRTR